MVQKTLITTNNCLYLESNQPSLTWNSMISKPNVIENYLNNDCVGLAQVVSSPLGRVIPKTIIKMVQTASLHRHACVTCRVGVWQCSPTV